MASSSGSNLNNKFLQGWDSIRLNQCHLLGRSHSTYLEACESLSMRKTVCAPNRNHQPFADPKKSKHSPSKRSIRAARLPHSAESISSFKRFLASYFIHPRQPEVTAECSMFFFPSLFQI